MKIIEGFKYFRNDGYVTGELTKTKEGNWFDTVNMEIYNNYGYQIKYVDTEPIETTKHLLHQDYFNNDYIVDAQITCACEHCEEYRETFDENNTNPIIENIIIYHEFLLEHSENYTGYASEFLTENYYKKDFGAISAMFVALYTDYEQFIVENNFECTLNEDLTYYLGNLNEKNEQIKSLILKLNSNKESLKVSGLNILNSLGITPDNFKVKIIKSPEEFRQFLQGTIKSEPEVNKSEIEEPNKRTFDFEYYYDVLDQIAIIRILKRKILTELNIKIVLQNPNGIKLKHIYDADYLKNTIIRLRNIYETSEVSEDGRTYLTIKTDKEFN